MKRAFGFLLVSLAAMAQGGFSGSGTYEIYSPLSRKVLDMDRNDQRTVIQYDNRHTDNQTWEAVDAGGGFFYFRNTMNGNALAVANDRNSTPLIAEPYTGSPNQQWKVEGGDNSSAVLVNRNGKAVDIPYGSTNNGVKINSYNRNNEVNQQWTFQRVGNANSRPNSRYDNNRNDNNRWNNGRRPNRGNNRYDNPGYNNSTTQGAAYFDSNERTYKMNGDGVCFYRDRDFQGEAVCAPMGAGLSRWTGNFSSIGSVRFFGQARSAQVFDRDDFRGNSVEVSGEDRDVSRSRNNRLRSAPRSIRVY